MYFLCILSLEYSKEQPFMLKLSFPNINEDSFIIFQKSYSENKSVAFHTWKGCYYITSRETGTMSFWVSRKKTYFLV